MKALLPFDLSEVTLVNESRSEMSPGDVSLFRSPAAACQYLEAWWVEGAEGTVLTATGDRLVLAPTEPVSIRSREPHPDGERLVQVWLDALALHVRNARQDQRPLPTSVSDLIAYVGFEN